MRSKKAFSIIEIMVMIVIMTMSIIWVYSVIISWRNLAHLLEDKQTALNYAREAIEVVQNIRDTNWQKYTLDSKDLCWFARNYSQLCIVSTSDNPSTISDGWNLYNPGEYILSLGKHAISVYWFNADFDSLESADNHYYLFGPGVASATPFANDSFANDEELFYIYLDESGQSFQHNQDFPNYTSDICTKSRTNTCRTRFRRVIEIEYPEEVSGTPSDNDFGISECTSSDGTDDHVLKNCLRATVTVQWRDNYSWGSHQVVLEQVITNWN